MLGKADFFCGRFIATRLPYPGILIKDIIDGSVILLFSPQCLAYLEISKMAIEDASNALLAATSQDSVQVDAYLVAMDN